MAKKNIATYLILLLMNFTIIIGCSQKKVIQQEETQSKTSEPMKTPEDIWKEKLSPEQYAILREKGTERPFTGKYLKHNEEGIYTCAGCGNELFSSDMKFDAHCGWPSFDRELGTGANVKKIQDNSHGMQRIEIVCSKCDGHLGHIFDDGPTSTGQRYCVNSLSLDFKPKNEIRSDTLVLGGGCFWCIEAVFLQTKGVKSVASGYAGGDAKDANYKAVCTGKTKHAEVIQIVFNPEEISVELLLKVFFTVHDPTTLNYQGNDVGPQYRSSIFYKNENQKLTAETVLKALNASGAYEKPVVTTLEPLTKFYKAEEYHQNYYNRNSSESYCRFVIQPKLEKFEKVFKDLIVK